MHDAFSKVQRGADVAPFDAVEVWPRRTAQFALGETNASLLMPGPLRIETLAGYTPAIGRVVGILTYARSTTIAAVDGLTLSELDHLHDDRSNSIGALLAHMVAVERAYQVLTLDDRPLSPRENALWSTALALGPEGRRELRGQPLEHYLEQLAAVRRDTLEALASRDDAWLDRSVSAAPKINVHWAWFHVAEDEINHRGQIRWLRARLPERFIGVSPNER